MIKIPQKSILNLHENLKKFLTEHYSKEIEEIKNNKKTDYIKIDYESLNKYLKEKNDVAIIDLRSFEVINKAIQELTSDEGIYLQLTDMLQSHKFRDISSKNIGKLVTFKAQVTRLDEIYPEIHLGYWCCKGCLKVLRIPFNINGSKQPVYCEDCGGSKFDIEDKLSEYSDNQILYLEQPLEESEGGKFQNRLKSILRGEIIKEKDISPGDIVKVTGFLKSETNKNRNNQFFFEINYVEKANLTYDDLNLTPDEEKKIIELAESGNAYNILAECVAPSISGLETLKKSLILQQFANKWIRGEDGSLNRETIHILLIGSPGVGKTQMLRSIAHLAPKGRFISCSTATSVGLTCAAENKSNGEWTIKAGAIPLTDGGTVCIDELDKISPNDLTKLNEALENGQISIAKAGITATLNSRCSVLACANPRYGIVNIYKSLMEQIEIADPTTLSRFDLIFLIKDIISEENDRKVLKQLNKRNSTPKLDYDFIRKYISFARKYHDPILGEDINDYLIDFFVEVRKASIAEDNGKPITKRDYEGLRRITKALARIDLADHAEMKHAMEAVRLYKKSLESLDLSILEGGAIQNVKSKADVELLNAVECFAREYYENNDHKGSDIPKELIKEVKFNFNLSYEESLKLLKQIVHYY